MNVRIRSVAVVFGRRRPGLRLRRTGCGLPWRYSASPPMQANKVSIAVRARRGRSRVMPPPLPCASGAVILDDIVCNRKRCLRLPVRHYATGLFRTHCPVPSAAFAAFFVQSTTRTRSTARWAIRQQGYHDEVRAGRRLLAESLVLMTGWRIDSSVFRLIVVKHDGAAPRSSAPLSRIFVPKASRLVKGGRPGRPPRGQRHPYRHRNAEVRKQAATRDLPLAMPPVSPTMNLESVMVAGCQAGVRYQVTSVLPTAWQSSRLPQDTGRTVSACGPAVSHDHHDAGDGADDRGHEIIGAAFQPSHAQRGKQFEVAVAHPSLPVSRRKRW